MSFVHSLKWSFLAELASKAITPIVFIVLARLLTPEDFGVMSAALMVIAFSQIFWEAGMGKALIQRQTDVEDAANVAFWVNLGLGILIAGLLFWGARPIALTFFQDVRVTAVLQVMTLQVLLGALSSVQTALLQKQMGFKKLFWVRLTTVALPGIASIPLAWSGMGYWALVAATLTGQTAQVFMLWRMNVWRPALRFRWAVAKPMAHFGAWVGASGLLAWFYVWADSLIVGKYLGVHDLGLYRVGNQITALACAVVFAPVTPVLYSHLSRLNGDINAVRLAMRKVIKALTVISVPLALIIFDFSLDIEKFVLGEKWQSVGIVIGVLALTHGFAWVVGMNGEAYRSIGRPNIETIAMGSTMAVYIMIYLYFVRFGLDSFVWARFGAMCIGFLGQFLVLKLALGLNINEVGFRMLLVASISLIVSNILRGFQVVPDASDTILDFVTSLGLICTMNVMVLLFVFYRAEFIRFVVGSKSSCWRAF